MALRLFAVLAAVAGTGILVMVFTEDNLSIKGVFEGITYAFLLLLAAVVLSAFDDVVKYLKTIAENSEKMKLIAQRSENRVLEDVADKD